MTPRDDAAVEISEYDALFKAIGDAVQNLGYANSISVRRFKVALTAAGFTLVCTAEQRNVEQQLAIMLAERDMAEETVAALRTALAAKDARLAEVEAERDAAHAEGWAHRANGKQFCRICPYDEHPICRSERAAGCAHYKSYPRVPLPAAPATGQDGVNLVPFLDQAREG